MSRVCDRWSVAEFDEMDDEMIRRVLDGWDKGEARGYWDVNKSKWMGLGYLLSWTSWAGLGQCPKKERERETERERESDDSHSQLVFSKNGSPSHFETAQYGTGIRIQFKPLAAILAKSSSVYSHTSLCRQLSLRVGEIGESERERTLTMKFS